MLVELKFKVTKRDTRILAFGCSTSYQCFLRLVREIILEKFILELLRMIGIINNL